MLQIAVKAINNTAGYDNIILILLVFRAFLQMTHINPPALLIAQQTTAIKKAIANVTNLAARPDSVRSRLGLCAHTDISGALLLL
jgi:hypothetical protein